jgi:hypothetical protein
MKSIQKLSIIFTLCFLIVILSLLSINCAKKPEELILGKWKGETVSEDDEKGEIEFEFKEDGTVIITDDGGENAPGNYTVEHDTISGKCEVKSDTPTTIEFGANFEDNDTLVGNMKIIVSGLSKAYEVLERDLEKDMQTEDVQEDKKVDKPIPDEITINAEFTVKRME